MHDLDEESAAAKTQLDRIMARTVPTPISQVEIGIEHAVQLLITTGQNIDRLDSEAGLTSSYDAAPIPVSSG